MTQSQEAATWAAAGLEEGGLIYGQSSHQSAVLPLDALQGTPPGSGFAWPLQGPSFPEAEVDLPIPLPVRNTSVVLETAIHLAVIKGNPILSLWSPKLRMWSRYTMTGSCLSSPLAQGIINH